MITLTISVLLLVLSALPALAGGLVIGPDSPVTDSYRWLDGRARDLGGLVYDGKDVTIERNVVRMYDAKDSNTVIRNSRFTLKAPTVRPNLPVALEYVAGHDHLIENVTASDFRMVWVKGKYLNGDCFSGERAASRITFRNVHARNCADGGYDFKSRDVRFENVTAEDSGKGFRVWGTASASTITCINWRSHCIEVNHGTSANPASFVIDKLVLKPGDSDNGATFGVHAGSTLEVKSCSGSLGKGAVVNWNGANPNTANVTLCGVKVTNVNKADVTLRAAIEAQMGKGAQPRAAAASINESAPAALCTFPTKLRDTSGDGRITLTKVNAAKCGGRAGMRVTLIREATGDFVYGVAK